MEATILYFHPIWLKSLLRLLRASYEPPLAIPQRSCGEQLQYDLALAVMDGVEARGHRGGYSTERFKFNSA
jgi:hypothetical protein